MPQYDYSCRETKKHLEARAQVVEVEDYAYKAMDETTDNTGKAVDRVNKVIDNIDNKVGDVIIDEKTD